MNKEEIFDKLLIQSISYWQSNLFFAYGYDNDNNKVGNITLNSHYDNNLPRMDVDYYYVWNIFKTTYSMSHEEVRQFTSKRLQDTYNFMDFTSWYYFNA